jgi:hypothetical protein
MQGNEELLNFGKADSEPRHEEVCWNSGQFACSENIADEIRISHHKEGLLQRIGLSGLFRKLEYGLELLQVLIYIYIYTPRLHKEKMHHGCNGSSLNYQHQVPVCQHSTRSIQVSTRVMQFLLHRHAVIVS